MSYSVGSACFGATPSGVVIPLLGARAGLVCACSGIAELASCSCPQCSCWLWSFCSDQSKEKQQTRLLFKTLTWIGTKKLDDSDFVSAFLPFYLIS